MLAGDCPAEAEGRGIKQQQQEEEGEEEDFNYEEEIVLDFLDEVCGCSTPKLKQLANPIIML